MMDIGDRIRKIRELKGLGHGDMAGELGMDVLGYARLEENARGLTFGELEAIARVLRTSVEDILGAPAQLNIHSVTGSQQVGFNYHCVYYDNRSGLQEMEGYVLALRDLEKEVGLLRQAVARLMGNLSEP